MKTLIEIIKEKLKVGSKTKVINANIPTIKDFSDYIENNNPFGKPLLNVNNKIQKGKCYHIYNGDPDRSIYAFPFYITMDEGHWLGIYLTYTNADKNNKDSNEEKDECRLSYVLGNIRKDNDQLRLEKLISHKRIMDNDEDIDFEKYINIIKKLYNTSKKIGPNEFLNKYEKIINETT